MFGKKEPPSSPLSVPVSTTSSNSNSTARNIDTIISASCVIDGNVRSTQSLKIDGRVEGNVQADNLIIVGTEGQVHGDITSAQLLVLGQLHGNVKVGSLHLQSTARIHGNIEAEVLQIDPGAQYQGTVTARSPGEAASSNAQNGQALASDKKISKDEASATPAAKNGKHGG